MRAPSHALVMFAIAVIAAACSAESSGGLNLNPGASPDPQAGANAEATEGETTSQSPTADATDSSSNAAPTDTQAGPSSDTVDPSREPDSGPTAPSNDTVLWDEDTTVSESDAAPEPDATFAADAEGGEADTTGPTLCDDGELIDCGGECSPSTAVQDGTCDDALNCEALDFDGGDCLGECGDGACDSGETSVDCPEDCAAPVSPENHPCEVSDAPGADDAAIMDCVCAFDSWCCSNTWDAFCVQLAEESCAAPCDCAALTCEVDSDCGGCFGDACIGTWSCADGLCSQGAAVVCENDPTTGCFINQCDPETGACVASPSDALCDDSSACTLDSCEAASGLCSYTDSGACGAQHPCLTSDAPGAGDAALMTCLCAVDPYCCQTAWDAACVAGASETCGMNCDCTNAPPETLACAVDADCAWCGESPCTGPFLCVDARCEPSAPVSCDATSDTACSKATCDPATGECAMVESDSFCEDNDPCTADLCDAESGACAHTPIEGCGVTHPCHSGEAPLSSDDAINACACDANPDCCAGAWSEVCVTAAQTECGLECDCAVITPDTLTCDTNADCAFCDDADLCNGTWLCQGGGCVETAPVTCDTSADSGCQQTACVPGTGACEQGIAEELCDDTDPCTDDSCDAVTGACLSEDNPACGVNHPCVSAPLPTSNDEEATACVCGINPYCCSGAWDATCVATAEAQCGQVCSCDDPEVPTLCSDDTECTGCDDGDLCNGTWGCVEGACAPLDEVVTCPAIADMGCLVNSCVPATGQCEMLPDDDACDDGDLCSQDICTAEGSCDATPIEGCSVSHPCAASSTPQSTDAEITACVCALDAWCCDNSWDDICVGEAISECGAVCDCADPASEATCTEDAECGWCSDTLCDTPWACSEGQCVAVGVPVSCDSSGDGECLANQCQPETGACAMVVTPDSCDDDDPCTVDSCGPDGACVHEVLDGCEGVPPFECLGTGEPSATGCGIVASYEGCCDPWGRVTWCQDGNTYCITCQENPSCGWQGAQGYYDCGNEPIEDPSGAAPMMCPAYGP